MTYTITWLDYAKQAFEQQINWYLNNMGKRAAKKFANSILKDAGRLSTLPYLGQTEPLLEDLPEHYRSLISGKHFRIVYFIEADIIYIAALRDCRQAPGQFMKNVYG